ncbi:hypothetical protein [Chryseobacterium sp. JUb7]|uniref:hypothetical protein n=1 Tax=Chryseobacterium sp. JUb7 TaxID=2940599 RepID=UPI002169599D|nr:hypothetical protein [Chryseobacterium sp. JUb7]MCS3528646.1 hypothetical protein [Chryseobacterium sp. JUb7]
MNKINITSHVKELSDSLFNDRKTEKIRYYPMDKFYILDNNYLEKILSVNHLEFLFYNLEMVNETYTVQLLACLPELWENIIYNDIIILIENFTNSFSFYALIEFTHKYLEIDLMDEIFYNENVKLKFKKDCIRYFPNIIASLYMNEFDYMEFEENSYGINIEQIKKIQLKFKNDDSFKKIMSKEELHKKLSEIKIMYQI